MHATHKPKSKSEVLHRKRIALQRAITGKPQKGIKGVKVQSDASAVLSMTTE